MHTNDKPIDMQKDVLNFLRLGYYLDYEPRFKWVANACGKPSEVPSRQLLNRAVGRVLSQINGGEIIVPISGGLDSRLILACVLDHVEAQNIYTYTFGEPGAWDFEIGNKVARKFGTRHTSFDLGGEKYSLDSAIYDSKAVGGQTIIILGTPFALIDREFGSSGRYISGFMGDPLAGSKYSSSPRDPHFSLTGSYVNSHTIAFPHLTSVASDAYVSWLQDERLTGVESLDFANRQFKYVAPHVCPNKDYFSPFLDREWVDAMLSLNPDQRAGCVFYHDMCLREFPEFFNSLPVKSTGGGLLSSGTGSTFIRKAANKVAAVAGKSGWLLYNDKARNYINVEYKVKKDRGFAALLDELVQIGMKSAIEATGVCENQLIPTTTMEHVILASLGAHHLAKQR